MTLDDCFFTLSRDPLYILGVDGYFKRVNPAFEKALLFSSEEFLSQPLLDFLHPEDRISTQQALLEVTTGAEISPVLNRFRCKDGSYRYFEWTLRWGSTLDTIYGVGRDLTPQKQIESELQINRDRLELAIKASELGTFYCEMPLDEIIWNNKCKEHFWLPPETEINFDLFYSIVHPDDRLRTQEAVAACIDERKAYDIEYRTVAPSGEIRWIRAIGNCFYDDSNNPFRFDGITIDITAQKKAEEEREDLLASERAARSEAERVNRMKDEFLATLSHELRTPLNAIVGWAQLLQRGTLKPERVKEALDVIERNVRVQNQLIEDLLDMNRIVSGKIRLNVERVDLASVIDAAIETVRLAAEAKDIDLIAVLNPLAGMISGDPNRLQQIVWNLLSNAIKFTPKGGKVEVLLERVDSHIEVSTTDNGQGIKPEFLPYVFDRFRQADASITRSHGGLGLGLSIVRSLTELHGGTVRARSQGEGKGATFTISLPLVAVHLKETESKPDLELDNTAVDYEQPSLSGVKVLVVDDEPDARNLIKFVLEECLAEVYTAVSAAEALDLLQRHQPDVLVSDIGMPKEDGYQLIRQIRKLSAQQGGKIPAVALTAYARAQDRKQALLSGYQMHVTKPVEASELVAIVSSLTNLI